jgi:hypothetical protein
MKTIHPDYLSLVKAVRRGLHISQENLARELEVIYYHQPMGKRSDKTTETDRCATRHLMRQDDQAGKSETDQRR